MPQSGDTALHYAAFCGFERIAQLLLDAGADVNAAGSDGGSPLAAAEEQEQAGVAALLRARGGVVVAPSAAGAAAAGSPASRARMTASTGFPSALPPGEAARLATDAAGYVRLRDLLCQSAFAGDLRACHELLTVGGVDVSAPDSAGSTALHKAAAGGSLHALVLLLGHGADANALDGSGHTALHYAAFKGNTDAAHALLASGCRPEARNAEGATAAAVARAQNNWAVVRLLEASWTRLPGMDFSYGVVREGPVQLRRSPESFLSTLFAWKDKYAVLSRSYGALFYWSGGAGGASSAIVRVACEEFEGVARAEGVRGWSGGGGGRALGRGRRARPQKSRAHSPSTPRHAAPPLLPTRRARAQKPTIVVLRLRGGRPPMEMCLASADEAESWCKGFAGLLATREADERKRELMLELLADGAARKGLKARMTRKERKARENFLRSSAGSPRLAMTDLEAALLVQRAIRGHRVRNLVRNWVKITAADGDVYYCAFARSGHGGGRLRLSRSCTSHACSPPPPLSTILTPAQTTSKPRSPPGRGPL